MDLEMYKSRINDVLKRDSITSSEYDFLATHVPMNRLQLLDTFSMTPEISDYVDEEYVYQRIVTNPENKHQLVAVYGESGTGKSHLIRWLGTKYNLNKPENEVVLFISRSSNTLKGTIKQLLAMPEVQNIKNKEVYDRLLNAAVEMPKKELISTIYHNFIVLIDNDLIEEKYETLLTRMKKKRLAEYLRSSLVEEQLSVENGPIERIYARIADSSTVLIGVEAKFIPEDFLDEDFNDRMQENGDLNHSAKSVIDTLNSEAGLELATSYAEYLNNMVSEVIQRCTGIQSGDFGEVFKEIRRELRNTGKNLTLFIEDITTVQGLDDALLDALYVQHTGKESGLCRLSSIIGGTSGYINNHFKQNHKDRFTKYVFLPNEAFDETRLYEFFARYLNALSIPKNSFLQWSENGADQNNMPILEAKEDCSWETVVLNNKKVSLCPFTKNAIHAFYYSKLAAAKRIPRYILKDILEPVLYELIDHFNQFPSKQFNFGKSNASLQFALSQEIGDQDIELRNRLYRFLTVWGNGQPEKTISETNTYISGINEKIFQEFDLPLLNFQSVRNEPAISNLNTESEQQDDFQEDNTEVLSSEDKENELLLSKIEEELINWENGTKIDISGTGGMLKKLRSAKGALSRYLKNTIDWESEGIPYRTVSMVITQSFDLITLSQTLRTSAGVFSLEPSSDSRQLLMAFCRYEIFGKESWKYKNAPLDIYIISNWTYLNKKRIVDEFKKLVQIKKHSYVEASICSELLRQVLNGEYKDIQLKNIGQAMFKKANQKLQDDSHVTEWDNALNYIYSENNVIETKENIQYYYHVSQGNEKNKLFCINSDDYNNTIKELRDVKFDIDVQDDKDCIVPQIRKVFVRYEEIRKRAKIAIEKELDKAKSHFSIISECFGSNMLTEEDLDNLYYDINHIMDTVNDIQINVSPVDLREISEKKSEFVKAIKNVSKIQDDTPLIHKLILFSDDPLSKTEKLISIINDLGKYLDKIDTKLVAKEEEYNSQESSNPTTDFDEEINRINSAYEVLGGLSK